MTRVLTRRLETGSSASIQLTRILRLDESHRLVPRVRQAVTNKLCHVPLLSGSLKDHKQVLHVRPVAGADEANNAQLSQMLAGIVTAVVEIVDKRIRSTWR